MVRKELKIANKIGLHARPASMLVEAAKKYDCAFTLEKAGASTDLKSMISLMKLQVKMGDTILLSARGADEEKGLNELAALIESGFPERDANA